jgi:hypothetical protein
MKLNRIFRHELEEVLEEAGLTGAGNFGNWSKVEHKVLQNLNARARRRAVRWVRVSGRKRSNS